MVNWDIILIGLVGVIVGTIVAALGFYIIEVCKNKEIRKNWAINLLAEVNNNRFKKTFILIVLYREIADSMNIQKANFFKEFINTFDVFQSFLNSGVSFKNKEIIHSYSGYILREKADDYFLLKNLNDYFNLKPNLRKNSTIRINLLKSIKQIENQLISINELYNNLEKECAFSLKKKGLKLDIESRELLFIR